MKGYIKNVASGWTHAFKRAVGPGQEITLDELYKQYGDKHNLKEGQEFVDWLKNVKIKNSDRWKIVCEDFNAVKESSTEVEVLSESPKNEEVTVAKSEKKVRVTRKNEGVTPIVQKELTSHHIASMTPRQAKPVLPKINDLNMLKYALSEANPKAGSDELCRLIRKRVDELQMTAR
jgi:hypothetical protein